jgi:RNA polymerase sigma factor (sigma-70 family)
LNSGRTDALLLGRFIDRRDGEAFAALVERHGPMVLGVCRRVLGDPHDAEDAFQATFLVLLRKARSVVPRERVGGWLCGVAYRTARKARVLAARRRVKERRAGLAARTHSGEACGRDLRELIDRELLGLPDAYRAAVVLCDLEGQTRREAARQLGWTEGTLSGRLARARALLANRLARRGVTVSAAGVAGALAPLADAGPVPARLAAAVVRVALLAGPGLVGVPAQILALTEGVVNAMTVKKYKLVAAAVLVLALGVGGTLGGRPGGVGAAGTDEPAPAATGPARAASVGGGGKDELPPYVIEPPDVLMVHAYLAGALGTGKAEPSPRGGAVGLGDSGYGPPGTGKAELSPRPVNGQYLVRPDGTIQLGAYGAVVVIGLTVDDAARAVRKQLLKDREAGLDPNRLTVKVDVLAYNSKRYYVITDGPGVGEEVLALPCTGSDAVLDALGQLQSLQTRPEGYRVWVVRRAEGIPDRVLPVDWAAIRREAATTNYRIRPGDRVYVMRPPDAAEGFRGRLKEAFGADFDRVKDSLVQLENSRHGLFLAADHFVAAPDGRVRFVNCWLAFTGPTGRSIVSCRDVVITCDRPVRLLTDLANAGILSVDYSGSAKMSLHPAR